MPPGGYRPPANPAAVSGPGALSRRTDGAPGQTPMPVTGQPYGAGQELQEQQRMAPMSDVREGRGAPAGAPTPQPQAQAPQGGPPQGGPPRQAGPGQVVSLEAESERPHEPITAGAPFGAGPGPLPQASGFRVRDLLGALLGSDLAGDLADLYLEAERMGL